MDIHKMTNLSAKTPPELSSIDRKVAHINKVYNSSKEKMSLHFSSTILYLNNLGKQELATELLKTYHELNSKLEMEHTRAIEKVWSRK